VVRRGETLYSIAWRFRLDYKKVAAWNRIHVPYTIFPGQRISLRAPRVVRRSQTATQRPSHSRPTTSRPKPPAVTKNNKVKPQARHKTSGADVHWHWPTPGKIVRTFNRKDDSRTGIDIAGKRGQKIRAARGGEVVYSGNGLIGYGELVIIKHSESFLSAYGHNAVRLVKEGQRVKAGTPIARMGLGKDNKPVLHFEIRFRGNPVDPMRYLPKH